MRKPPDDRPNYGLSPAGLASQHENRLLVFEFDRYEPHGRPCDGPADRFGIGSICFAPLPMRLDVGWRQSNQTKQHFQPYDRAETGMTDNVDL